MTRAKPSQGDLPTYLTPAQAERLLGIGETFLGELVASGDLRAYRLGSRTIRFELGDVLALLKPVTGKDPA